MSEITPRFSGFFTRRRNNNSDQHVRARSSEPASSNADNTRSSTDRPDSTPASATSFGPFNLLRDAEDPERRSFFRLPRRKKASSVSKGESTNGKLGIDRDTSMDQPRISLQTSRSPLETIIRPTMNLRNSTGNLATNLATSSAIVAASTSLAVQGSPRLEVVNPLEAKSLLSRQGSQRSLASQKSTQSTPASDKSIARNMDIGLQLPSRGRSLTYGGPDFQRKGSSTGRSSKFFSMGRLLREPDEVSLFKPLSGESNWHQPLQPKVETEKPMAFNLPARADGEATSQFLARLESRVPKTSVASVLATSDDSFHNECLESYMMQFDFVDDPLDIALRKLLMDTHLPKETQQIDRVLNAFSARYQSCNPHLYDSHATPYVLSFALIMLHTDRFNQNNKNKMTKAQFIKNTTSEHTVRVSVDVLEYFYDNIVSTPFILVEDDFDGIAMDQSGPTTPNEGSNVRNGSISVMSMYQNNNTFGKRSLDLYPLIMENKIGSLRPPLGSILEHHEQMSYTGTLPVINVARLHKAFTQPASLQLVSARSRPEAFATDHSIQNPLDTDPGLVEIQISKIGVLRKKEQKKAGSKPVHREWGVMLTASQILLFKNVAWVKHYMNQTRDQLGPSPLILAPPVQNFSPDAYLPTANTVAVFDSSNGKKATHFSFFGRAGDQTSLIASSEEEMNDWVAKINYAAAFQTVGIRIRGTHEKSPHAETMKRISRQHSMSTLSTTSSGMSSQQEIVASRQALLQAKIQDLGENLKAKELHLSLLQQQVRNLCTLTPILPRTRASVISAAGSLSAKLSWARTEHVKTQCHRDILAKDLELEMNSASSVFTSPVRLSTPPPGTNHQRTSPKKNKLGSVVGSLMRQVSSETIRRVNRQHGSSELKQSTSESAILAQNELDSTYAQLELDTEYIASVDFSPESLGNMFQNSSVESHIGGRRENAPDSTLSLKDKHLPGPSALKVKLLPGKRNGKRRSESNELEDSSTLSSPSSATSSGHFILHGRKVSVVQTPVNLLESTLQASTLHTPGSSISSHGTQDFQDAREHVVTP